MKTYRTNRALLAFTGLTALFLGGTVSPLSTASAQQPGSPAPRHPRDEKGERRERHPELRRAMHGLEMARMSLKHADRDFSGHRAKALQLTEQALAEVQAAFKADAK